MPDELPLQATFDTAASLYDEARPGYPDVIIDAIVERSRLPAEAVSSGSAAAPGRSPGPSPITRHSLNRQSSSFSRGWRQHWPGSGTS
jgi:hypothetical protein